MTKVFRLVTGLMGGLALSAVATVANDSEWGQVAGQQVVEVSGEVPVSSAGSRWTRC